jgi:structural maintenance of chromosomes protein 6
LKLFCIALISGSITLILGKSAIAAALQLCLGSRASTTGRGSKIAGLVRIGSEKPAVLRVTLRNTGVDAYRPELYGKKITVQRTIPHNGASTYQMFDSNGVEQEKMRARAELDSMLKCYNLVVDSSSCILTQEKSKILVHGSNKEKYQFFMEATGLAKLHADYQEIEKTLIESQVRMESMKPKLKEYKLKFKEDKSKLDSYSALDAIDAKIQELTAKCYWDDLRTSEGVLARLVEDMQQQEENVQTKQAELDAEQGDTVDKQSELQIAHQEIDEITKEQEVVQQAVNALTNEENKLQSLQKTTCTKIGVAKADKADLEAQIKTEVKEVGI